MKDKLEVGMYVRTLTLSGISKIAKLEKIDDICITDNGAVDKNTIIKAINLSDPECEPIILEQKMEDQICTGYWSIEPIDLKKNQVYLEQDMMKMIYIVIVIIAKTKKLANGL